MARFARDRRVVQAIADGVDALLHAPAGTGFDSHDLINWLNDNRNAELNDLYDLYLDCPDPEMTADQQIAKYLERLGQIKVDERVSARRIDRRGGGRRNGVCGASVWEVSDRTRQGLRVARGELFGPGGFFDRIAAEPPPAAAPGWFDRTSGSLKDVPEADYQEFLEYCRQAREELNRQPTDPDGP